MRKTVLACVTAIPQATARRWRGLSPRKRTVLALAFWVLAWQGLLSGLRLLDDPALPEMNVTMLSGESTTLAALADGKPMVVNLWASWCPPCRREMPMLAAAQQHENGVNFVFSNQGENRAAIQRYLSASQLDLTNVTLDRHSELGRIAGSGMLPVTLFYDANGQLAATHLGELSEASLARNLNRLRAP